MDGVGVGSMLVVPFARRRILGVVVDVAEHSDVPPEKLAEPLSALEADVPPELVNLGLWVAREYVSTPARGLALVLPPGTGTGSGAGSGRGGRCGRRSPRPAGPRWPATARLGSRQRAALEALAAGPGAGQRPGRGHRLRPRRRAAAGAARAGRRWSAPTRHRRARARRWWARGPTCGRCTAAQEAALAEVVAAMDAPAGTDRRLLLHGVTGSGKTEVYLRAVAAALERGRTAIVLVPEIALTPQTAGRFVQRFGDTVAVLHSQLTARERYDEWARLRSGAATVCVGPRSAVFAPLTDVGLIVVDEEHDGSYKQEGDPRYDARTVAERRAAGRRLRAAGRQRDPAARELRSATGGCELAERVDGQPLPPVELVGMTGVSDALHPRTRDALAEVAAARREGDGAAQPARLVELPDLRRVRPGVGVPGVRRVAGAAPRRRARCRATTAATASACRERCPDCDSVSLRRHGLGTEQLGAELERLVAPLPVLRLDADSVAAEGVAATLERFEAAPVGRARGHPDGGQGPRLRRRHARRGAGRRQHAALPRLPRRGAHVRAGGPAGGPQRPRLGPRAGWWCRRWTRRPARSSTPRGTTPTGFLRGELGRRQALAYPPYGHLVRVVCSSAEPGPEHEAATALRERLDPPGAVRARAPCPCSAARARSAPSSWCAAPTARARSPRCARRSRRSRPRSAARAWRWRWTWTRSSAQSRSTPAL